MNNKKKNVIFSVSFVCIATLLVLCSNFFLGKKENIIKSGEQNKKKIAETEKKSETESREYLSITYTTGNSFAKSGRMMNFYTYDINTNKLDRRAQIPFDSQYALGTVSLKDNKVYYTKTVGRSERCVDHLFSYDLSKKKSVMLEDENCAYNDLVPMKGKLLVTTEPVHAIGTGTFNLETGKFSYLYDMDLTEDGYRDFLFTTRPVSLNYNPHYNRFINVSELEKELYDGKVRSGEKPFKYHIALVDDELKVRGEYIFPIWDEEVTAATLISSDTALLVVEDGLYDYDADVIDNFYEVNFKEQTCVKIKTPFPKMRYVDNFITTDNGKSYYIKGKIDKKDESGLYLYDCSDDTVKPILLNDFKGNNDNHIVNFCWVKQ